MNRQADPPPPPVDENILVPINSELTLQADCIEMPRPDPALNGRNIRIVGRIFDKNRQLLQKAKIAFIPNNQIGVADTVDLSTGDSTYQVLLNTNSREIVIEVLGIDVNTDSIVSKFTTFLDSLCDNRSRRRFIKQDHITEPWMSFIQNKEPAFLPFFFETDVSERFLNHEMQSNTYYKFIFQNASKNTAKFIFVGYADERGNSQHNDALSRNRAITIRNHFAFALGYLEKRMKSFGAGETTKFNNDDWKKYSYYVPDNLRKIYGAGKEKLWFQNRRVLVYFDY